MNPVLYRPNVAAILRRSDGSILVGERADVPGCWQFPQGGQKQGETPEAALARELVEEIGLDPGGYRLAERRGPYRYEFSAERTKDGFRGQEQTYFLLDLVRDDEPLKVDGPDPEFRGVRWLQPGEYRLEWLPDFKRGTYRQVLHDFFGVRL